jgi:hypothetical protein
MILKLFDVFGRCRNSHETIVGNWGVDKFHRRPRRPYTDGLLHSSCDTNRVLIRGEPEHLKPLRLRANGGSQRESAKYLARAYLCLARGVISIVLGYQS